MDPEDRCVGSDEARSNLEQRDAHVTISRHAKPVAVVVPVDWYDRVTATISAGTAPA
jgi:prevent-host-death family protein